jgi:excinuclease ABC subunit C
MPAMSSTLYVRAFAVSWTKQPDCDACGWSQGTLVSLAIRAGRLTNWIQRACGEAAASRHVAGTPPEWAAFAQRSAELAARLSG